MKPHCRASKLSAVALFMLTPWFAGAQNDPAAAPSAPEAVGHLLFSSVTTAMPKIVSAGRVTWRGNMIAGDPERTILSIAESRASPCLFEVFFVEAPITGSGGAGAVTTAYSASIDLRRLDAASLRRAVQPAGGAQLTLRAKEMFCSRSVILEQRPKLTYRESCLDQVDDPIPTDDVPRVTAAFETLRRLCRW